MIYSIDSEKLTAPSRRIKGRAARYSSAALSTDIKGRCLFDIDIRNSEATVSHDCLCYGGNLIDYYNEPLTSYDGAEPVLSGDLLSLSTTGYYFYRRYSDEAWITDGCSYTFSMDVLAYDDTEDSQLMMGIVIWYGDNTYTEANKAITDTGRYYISVSADSSKLISYIEIRPLSKQNQTSNASATISNLMLMASINETAPFERYKHPVASKNGVLKLYAPNSTVISNFASRITYNTTKMVNDYPHDGDLVSLDISRDGENKFFGFGVSQKLTMKLRDPTRIYSFLDNDYFTVTFNAGLDNVRNFPKFYLTEVNRDENTNELTITAADLIAESAKHTLKEINIKTYSIKEMAAACATILGLELEIINVNDASFDTRYNEGANFSGNENLREVLNDIAEVTQTVFYVTETKLVFKRLDKTGAAVLHIPKADYFTLNTDGSRMLTTIVSATELGDNISHSIEGNGETQYVRNNAFWDLRADRAMLLMNAVNLIGGLAIEQVKLKWRGNYLLEVGDKITVEGKDGNNLTFYLLEDNIVYNGGFIENTNWSLEDNKRETPSNPASLGEALKETFAKVDKVDKTIELVVNDVSALKLTTNSITASVSTTNKDVQELKTAVSTAITPEDVRLEIQKELLDGVDRVTTGTGFTFNEAGLNISKSGSEMNTTITEDGMNVYRDENIMLSANNTGVDAVNLRANTYLIIGLNSRFENYNNGSRTGCFWIG